MMPVIKIVLYTFIISLDGQHIATPDDGYWIAEGFRSMRECVEHAEREVYSHPIGPALGVRYVCAQVEERGA